MVDVSEDYSIDQSTLRSVRQKVVLVGDVSVGKTSIINRFTENKFKDIYDVNKFLNFFFLAVNRSRFLF